MSSLRMWLVSGTFAAGMGAGILCGAGLATADAGDSAGASGPSVRAVSEPPRTDRAAGRASAVRAESVATRVAGARVTPVKKPTKAATPTLTGTTTLTRPVRSPKASAEAPSAAAAVAPAPAAAVTTAAKPVPVAASSVPVDPAKFAGTYYEQGSVKQFFSIGLVNTSATYTANPDGTIKVQNSGNYFFNRGPRSSIVGSAVPVNAINTALNVGFFSPRPPSATPPGNYTILETAPDYSYVLVSDPSGRSGYILTRSKTISPEEYQRLTDRARELGVTGRITPTRQFPA